MSDLLLKNKELLKENPVQKTRTESVQKSDVMTKYEEEMQTVQEDVRLTKSRRVNKQPTNFMERAKTFFKGADALGLTDVKNEPLTVVQKKRLNQYYSERRKDKEKAFFKNTAAEQLKKVKDPLLKTTLSIQAQGTKKDTRENYFRVESAQVRTQINMYEEVLKNGANMPAEEFNLATRNLMLLKNKTLGTLEITRKIANSNAYVKRLPAGFKTTEEKKREADEKEYERKKAEAEALKKKPGPFTAFTNLFSRAVNKVKDKAKETFEGLLDKATTLYKQLESNNFSRDAENEVLFPHAPCITDVAQYGTGDCFLLSAVSSILQTKPDYIREMMIDKGNTAVVRFYVGPNQPRYYEVKKDVSDNCAKGPLWMQVLEKAFCYFRLDHGVGVKVQDMPITRENEAWAMDQIELGDTTIADGGTLAEAMKALTGKQGEVTGTGARPSSFIAKKKAMLKRSEKDTRGISEETLKQLPYSGEYDTNAMNVLKEIQRGLGDGHFVTTGTFDFKPLMKDFATKDVKDHHVIDGLVGGHAYSVVGVEPRIVENYNGTKKYEGWFIKLHNPWGEISRNLQKEAPGADFKMKDASESGIIEMELNDFLMTFNQVSVGKLK